MSHTQSIALFETNCVQHSMRKRSHNEVIVQKFKGICHGIFELKEIHVRVI
jgi:hypothetical protein